MRDESDEEQLKLVKKTCQGQQACQLDATRQFFGNDECPGTEDEKMALWLEYSCVGGTDRTTTRAPICNGIEPPSGPPVLPCKGGERIQLDVRGCGGWINLDCKGGCLNIRKVRQNGGSVLVLYFTRAILVTSITVNEVWFNFEAEVLSRFPSQLYFLFLFFQLLSNLSIFVLQQFFYIFLLLLAELTSKPRGKKYKLEFLKTRPQNGRTKQFKFLDSKSVFF